MGVGEPFRLADVLGGLSVVSDMGYGLPRETAMRACVVGTALARAMDLPEEEVGHVFYVSLLLHLGCVAFPTRPQCCSEMTWRSTERRSAPTSAMCDRCSRC
jgi:hypothetical protein